MLLWGGGNQDHIIDKKKILNFTVPSSVHIGGFVVEITPAIFKTQCLGEITIWEYLAANLILTKIRITMGW